MIARVAPSDSPVLITGESGTGKELVAHMLHRLSGAQPARSWTSSCASLAEGMLESELFGHERGAFPGADERKLGLMELAAGGTLFLDEIGELSPEAAGQAAARARSAELLSRRRHAEGARSTCACSPRRTAISPQRVAEGTFRDDLYYRINTIAIELPPLRDRAVDIPLLARQFLKQFGKAQSAARSRRMRIELLAAVSVAGQRARAAERDRARRAARARDRRSTRATCRCSCRRAGAATARRRRRSRWRSWSGGTSSPCCTTRSWHQGRAASTLGISSKTLYRKIREYGFRRPGGVE